MSEISCSDVIIHAVNVGIYFIGQYPTEGLLCSNIRFVDELSIKRMHFNILGGLNSKAARVSTMHELFRFTLALFTGFNPKWFMASANKTLRTCSTAKFDDYQQT